MTLLGCFAGSVVFLVVLFIIVYWIILPPFAALWHGVSSLWRSGRDNIAPRVESAWFEFQTRSGEPPDDEFTETAGEREEETGGGFEPGAGPGMEELPPLPPPPVPDPPEIPR